MPPGIGIPFFWRNRRQNIVGGNHNGTNKQHQRDHRQERDHGDRWLHVNGAGEPRREPEFQIVDGESPGGLTGTGQAGASGLLQGRRRLRDHLQLSGDHSGAYERRLYKRGSRETDRPLGGALYGSQERVVGRRRRERRSHVASLPCRDRPLRRFSCRRLRVQGALRCQ